MKKRLFKTISGMVAFMLDQSSRGHAWHIIVLHHGWCSPSRCTCEPWYDVRPLTEESLVEGAELQARWVRESSS
jgi:hypothetical protein